MGYSSTSRADLSARQAYRYASGTSFQHHVHTSAQPHHLRTVHSSVDPKWLNSFGQQVRECRDSAQHPFTLPVAVAFDQTGSMGTASFIVQEKLATLKGALLRAGLTDAQLCFAAYGDAQNHGYGDYETAPCQVGQFESGIEMEDYLNNLFIEGNGGGNGGETSGLLLYFLARHSQLDSVIKRGKRGYLIITGDESPLPYITRDEVQRVLGYDIQGDLTIQQVVAEVTQLYDVYFFHLMTESARAQNSLTVWQGLLGADHVVPLENLDTISEQITMLIARLEGVVRDMGQAAALLLAEGADPGAVARAGKAMAVFEQNAGTVAPASSTGRLPGRRDGKGAKRL
jgi:hypothetical protein